MRIGIPRALHTYYFFPMWHFFLSELGAEAVLSPPSNKRILGRGIELSVSDICVPMKLFFGHVASLAESAEGVFIPRVASVHPKRFFCPKFIALPDMVKAVFPELRIITADLNAKEGWRVTKESFSRAGKQLGASPSKAGKVFEEAVSRQFEFGEAARDISLFELLEKEKSPSWQNFVDFGELPSTGSESELVEDSRAAVPSSESARRVAILGYPYIVHDGLVSLNIKDWFRRNSVDVATYEMIPREALEAVNIGLSRDVYWEASRNIIQAAIWCLDNEAIDGVIFMTSFGCGPGSMKKEIIERRARRAKGRPFMSLVVDEHTAPGGFITRLEAFMDMVEFRRSKHGNQEARKKS